MATTLDEVWALFREVAESQKDTDRKMKETDRQIKQLSKQIGELGNRLGIIRSSVEPVIQTVSQNRNAVTGKFTRGQ